MRHISSHSLGLVARRPDFYSSLRICFKFNAPKLNTNGSSPSSILSPPPGCRGWGFSQCRGRTPKQAGLVFRPRGAPTDVYEFVRLGRTWTFASSIWPTNTLCSPFGEGLSRMPCSKPASKVACALFYTSKPIIKLPQTSKSNVIHKAVPSWHCNRHFLFRF